jgi:hypothetical protein
MCDNGLIANLHKDYWQRCVKDRIERLSPSVKDKVIACFKILDDRHRFVRHPRKQTGDPASDIDWLDLALESHAKIPFHGIVLGQALLAKCGREDAAFMELAEALDSSQWQNRRRSLTLNKREADYRVILAPLLRYARALTLVDPYLNSHELRFFKTVQICSELMGQRGSSRLQGRIFIMQS